MMLRPEKIRSLSEAIGLVSDGDVVAIGGAGGWGHPMAAVREIIRQGRRGLHVVGCSECVGMDLLIAAGCASAIEPSATHRLRAAALGAPMLPLPDAVDDFGPRDIHARAFVDPFTGKTSFAVPSLAPSFGIIHVHRADSLGNAEFVLGRRDDSQNDLMIARASRRVIVTAEQIVSEATLTNRQEGPILSGENVVCVAEAPFGAHPCGFDGRYTVNSSNLESCQAAALRPGELADWLSVYVSDVADHWSYVNLIGSRTLMRISLNRASRS